MSRVKMGNNSFIGRIFSVASVLVLLASWGCGEKVETGVDAQTQERKAKWVKLSPVMALPPRGSVEYVGILSAHRKGNVASETGGTIERLYFEKGDRVEKGQLLAEVSTTTIRFEVQRAEAAAAAARSQMEKVKKGCRPEELLIAKAGLKGAEAAFLEAEKNFGRIKDLYDSRAVSDRDYDSAKRVLEMARARAEVATQQLALARQGVRIEDRKAAQANLEQVETVLALAKDRLKKSRLDASLGGIVAFRRVEEGDVIPPGIPIAQIIDLQQMKITVLVNEKDIRVLDELKRFTFTVDAISGEEFFCRLSFLSPAAHPVTRSFPSEFTVDKVDHRMIDGMTARIRFPIRDEKRTVKVPSAWLSEEDGRLGLFVVKDGKALFRRVTLGDYYDRRVEILSGVSDKEQVITNPAGLKSGDPVKY